MLIQGQIVYLHFYLESMFVTIVCVVTIQFLHVCEIIIVYHFISFSSKSETGAMELGQHYLDTVTMCTSLLSAFSIRHFRKDLLLL